jgi:hypothetical protein
LAKL